MQRVSGSFVWHRRAPRWQKPSNVPGVTIGNLLLEQRAFENSTAWLWTGVPFIFCSIILMDVMIVLALTFLSCACS